MSWMKVPGGVIQYDPQRDVVRFIGDDGVCVVMTLHFLKAIGAMRFQGLTVECPHRVIDFTLVCTHSFGPFDLLERILIGGAVADALETP